VELFFFLKRKGPLKPAHPVSAKLLLHIIDQALPPPRTSFLPKGRKSVQIKLLLYLSFAQIFQL